MRRYILTLAFTAGAVFTQLSAQEQTFKGWPDSHLSDATSAQCTIEVLVYSSLSNHYQSIPSPYRGKPHAGLFGAPGSMPICGSGEEVGSFVSTFCVVDVFTPEPY